MKRLHGWLRNLFTRPEIEPFVPEEDEFVQRAREAKEASQERRRQHREWLSEPLADRFRTPHHHKGGEQ